MQDSILGGVGTRGAEKAKGSHKLTRFGEIRRSRSRRPLDPSSKLPFLFLLNRSQRPSLPPPFPNKLLWTRRLIRSRLFRSSQPFKVDAVSGEGKIVALLFLGKQEPTAADVGHDGASCFHDDVWVLKTLIM
jgi:hypothetical protein